MRMLGAQVECSGNLLLDVLAQSDFELIRPHLTYVSLERGTSLVAPGQPIDSGYFLTRGLASVLATFGDGSFIEVALCGRDGLVGTSALLGGTSSFHTVVVQVGGEGYHIPADALRSVADRSATLRTTMLRYVRYTGMQMARTVLTNAKCSVEQRLARWLLMAHDRHPGDELALTHETLAQMLGVQRPTVTTALHALEGHGIIRSVRALIIVRDRSALERLAGKAYGRFEADFERLIAPSECEVLYR